MSEREPSFESAKHHEHLVDPEHYKKIEKALHENAERARQKSEHENLTKLESLVNEQAESRHNVAVEQAPEAKVEDLLPGVQQLLKSKAYDRTLAGVQQKLPKPVRLFSRITHNKTVEKVSEVSAKTVARPSGILGGSVCAFIGSLVVLYYSKHYGFTYNYALFMLLFAGGFLIGALIEFGLWAWHTHKHGKY